MALKAAVELALTIVKNWRRATTCDGLEGLFVATIFLGLSAVFVVGVLVTIGIGMLRVFFMRTSVRTTSGTSSLDAWSSNLAWIALLCSSSECRHKNKTSLEDTCDCSLTALASLTW